MFELIRKTPLKEYNGEGLFFVHKETGMEVFHIKNKDSECTCNFIFSTPSEDDKGLAHILEHTVLCGSKRFPVKDPFCQASLSSPNTFLNAVTFGDKTMFPLASPLKKDFDNLFDIYADSVFAPLLRKESFLQEGIRCFDGKFDGVVFNEMCGARSTEDSAVQVNSTKYLFKGTPYAFDSGGDPLCIVDLTYEEFLERYRKWYSPSNCRLFLFGDLDTYEYLEKLEKRYLDDSYKTAKGKTANSKTAKGKTAKGNLVKGYQIIPKSENYLQKHMKPFRKKVKCAAKEASSVVLTWLTTPSSDPLEILTVSILVDILLGNPGAPLYKAIVESNLGEDLNPMSGTDPDSPVLTFTVGFSKAKKNKEDEIETFLLRTIEKLIEEGLPKDSVAAAIKRQEFKLQEIPSGGIPFGISTSLKAARTWLRGKDPELGVQDIKRLEVFKERMKDERYLENWMEKNLIDNPRRCLLTVESSPSYDEKFKAKLEEKAHNLSSLGLLPTKEEKRRFEEFVNTPDSPEDLARIGRISREDLPLKVPNYKTQNIKTVNGAKLYFLPVFTRSIVYISMAFDTKGIGLEEKKLLPLLVRLLNMCGTCTMSYSQVGTSLKLLTGGFAINMSAGKDIKGKPVSFVIIKTKVLREDFNNALSLIDEILLHADLQDYSRIKAALTDLLTDYESGYTYSGNSYAVLSASSTFSSSAMESEITIGTSCWLYMQELKKKINEDSSFVSTLSALLTNLYKKIFVQRSLKVHIGCEEPLEECQQILIQHIDKYPAGKFVRTSNYYSIHPNLITKLNSPKRFFCVSSLLAYNALALKFSRLPKCDEHDLVGAMLLAWVLTMGYLWNDVRSRNGAYGVECHVDEMENLFVFSSYRDPCVKETFEEFFKSFNAPLDTQALEYGIVSMIGRDIKTPTPQMMCSESFRRIIYGIGSSMYKKRRKLLLSLTVDDVKNVANKILKEGQKDAVQVTVGNREKLCNSEKVDIVSLPV